LTEILRKEWGFPGIVDSDYTALAELIPHGIANDGATAARKAFLAGVDMDMVSSLYHDHLAKLVRSGEVPEAAVDEAVRRVLRVKGALGLFENPYTDETKEAGAMLHPDSLALARTAAEESFVLLKNANVGASPLLPLPGTAKTFALIGPLANDRGNMLGSWAGQGRAQDVITLRAALNERIGSKNLRYAKGAEFVGGTDDQLEEAVKAAEQTDIAILALGENAPEMTGEAASRASLGLPGRQEELLEKVVATGKPVVLLIFSGRPLTLPWAFQHVPAVIAAWFPGIQAGPALTRTLFGETNPGGRLVVSWPRSVGQEPLYYDALNTGRPAGKIDLTRPPRNTLEKYVSRYIDEQNSPQFPFGFGLSYTTFRYGNLHIDRTQMSAKSLNEDLEAREHKQTAALAASADITNTGTLAGVETVECYLRFQGTSVAQPVRALTKFQRISLAPGETRKVTFLLGPNAFAIWNEQQKFAVEPAKVTLWIAPDSSQGLQATLEITK
jgi:beta-glucosidase